MFASPIYSFDSTHSSGKSADIWLLIVFKVFKMDSVLLFLIQAIITLSTVCDAKPPNIVIMLADDVSKSS